MDSFFPTEDLRAKDKREYDLWWEQRIIEEIAALDMLEERDIKESWDAR